MTQCTQSSFSFARHFSRKVAADFQAGTITSHGGGLLLREVDQRINLIQLFTACFQDHRDQTQIEHKLQELIAQRVYGLVLGYEDVTDHEQLRKDPLLALLAGRPDMELLAGKSTLNRLELGQPKPDRYKKISYESKAIDALLVEVFLEAHPQPPQSIVLDLDVTDLPLHGHQQGRFFHGYYDNYCYLPLYIFCGEHLLCVRLRTADQDGAAGSVEEVERVVQQIRQRWPQTVIILRADSGFCREALMSWCEQQTGVEFVLGLARNSRLREMIDPQMAEAAWYVSHTTEAVRLFTEFSYQTANGSWNRARRVVAKAEQLPDKENPRFVVTSLAAEAWPTQKLYEQLYCARGEMENRIKEQLSLFADRVSTETLRSNQLRLYFSALAYVLMQALRRLALQETELAQAQCCTLRLKLLRIGAVVSLSVRRLYISLSSSYPYQQLFRLAYQRLQAIPIRC